MHPTPFQTPLSQLAALAPELSGTELRVCLYLVYQVVRAAESRNLFEVADHYVQASSREIAEATGCARSSVVQAIDDLNRRSLIATRNDSGIWAATHRLNFFHLPSPSAVIP